MMLHERLSAVAGAVRAGSRVADIGTDHAYLPVYLVQNGICPTAIAADIRRGPLAAAERTVAAAGFTDRIAVRLGDGLAPIRPDEVDDIVIAGMGGETITAILTAAPWVKAPQYRLILQPMTKAEVLHAYLMQNGFAIEREWLVAEDRRRYIVLVAAFTDAPPISDAVAHWRGAFEGEDSVLYGEKTAAHLRKRAAGCEKSAPQEAQRLRAIAAELSKR